MRPGGLGRGLDALIPGAGSLQQGEDNPLRELSVHLIEPNRFQPRGHFDDEALAELTASVRALGVLQPVLVRAAGDHFELIAGERRWRAAKAAGLQTIPALVREADDTASIEQALVENLHRQDLSAIEEAAAYEQLAAEFSLSYEAIGEIVGKSRSAVANTVRLLQLPVEIQRMVNQRVISAGHARALLGLDDAEDRARLIERIVAEDLSVRATEEAVRALQLRTDAPVTEPDAALDAGEELPGDPVAQRVEAWREQLAEHLATRVKISVSGKQKGKISVDFSGWDDLERLCWAIAGAGDRTGDDQAG